MSFAVRSVVVWRDFAHYHARGRQGETEPARPERTRGVRLAVLLMLRLLLYLYHRNPVDDEARSSARGLERRRQADTVDTSGKRFPPAA